jgi:hypothetical protein
MAAFRGLLVLMFIVICAYTTVVMLAHGVDPLPVFFEDIAAMTWHGQFNLDFMCFLILSGLWVAWRHQFSAAGIALGLLATIGGAPFLSAYLIVHSIKADGDVRELLLGSGRVT